MVRQLNRLIAERSSSGMLGRELELEKLTALLEVDGPIVAFVHGIAGIGKSTLLHSFSERARQSGAMVIEIDGASIEPSARGYEAELAAALGLDSMAPHATVIERLGDRDGTVLLTIDVHERLRLLDTWLRQEFVPELPMGCRVVIAGRDRPQLGWTAALAGAFVGIELEGIPEVAAREVLASTGLGDHEARELARLTYGHPLALQLAAAAPRSAVGTLVGVARTHFVNELTSAYVGDLPPETRMVVEAASVVRRATRSILRVLLPTFDATDAFESLERLPFVSCRDDGLALHDLVRDVVRTSLRSTDPDAYAQYRRAAWRQLTLEARHLNSATLWRYTADLLALIENPVVREAFFPVSTDFLAVEPACSADGPDIIEITEAVEPPSAAQALIRFWSARPDRFSVVRDHGGGAAGFFAVCLADQVAPAVLDAHPVMTRWRQHLTHHPVSSGERVLYMPRWLSRGVGEAPSPAQAASWLDVKRLYMELRPNLRRLYTAVIDLGTWAPVVLPLGFVPLPELDVEIDGVTFHTAMLDFGPGSVDGWLAMRVAGELDVDDPLLSPADRTCRTAAGRVPLTRLEFGVMEMLSSRPSVIVTRQQLLASVWGSEYTEGSNVVDAVVRTLRRKLGADGGSVETVRGLGYRYGG